MATDRERAKQDISDTKDRDPALEDALSSAQRYQLDLTREEHRHSEAMHRSNLGTIGRFLGGERSAPIVVAALAAAAGMIAFLGCLIAAYHSPQHLEFWSRNTERSLAFALAALAYIFGKAR